MNDLEDDSLLRIATEQGYEQCDHCNMWYKIDGEDFCYCQTHRHQEI